MISNPEYGWCEFDLGDFHGTPSYMTNVPVDLLECFINYFKYECSCCYFDEEGSDFTLVLTPYEVYIIENKEDEPKVRAIDVMIIEMVKELINDIESNIEEWACFHCGVLDTKVQVQYIKQLRKLIYELEEFI